MAHGDAAMVLIPEDGDNNATTVMALQRMLKNAGIENVGPIDGRMGCRTTKALKSYLQAQGYEVGPIDGSWLPKSIKSMQQWLADGGFYRGEIDSCFNAATIQALQAALNAITVHLTCKSASGLIRSVTERVSAEEASDQSEGALTGEVIHGTTVKDSEDGSQVVVGVPVSLPSSGK